MLKKEEALGSDYELGKALGSDYELKKWKALGSDYELEKALGSDYELIMKKVCLCVAAERVCNLHMCGNERNLPFELAVETVCPWSWL